MDTPARMWAYASAATAPGADGLGIVPVISMLRTFADRDDPRPCYLFYASRTLESTTFLEEVRALERRLSLTLVLVLENPPRHWTGERGRIEESVIRRRLPQNYPRMQFFICGPPPCSTPWNPRWPKSACRPRTFTPNGSCSSDRGMQMRHIYTTRAVFLIGALLILASAVFAMVRNA